MALKNPWKNPRYFMPLCIDPYHLHLTSLQSVNTAGRLEKMDRVLVEIFIYLSLLQAQYSEYTSKFTQQCIVVPYLYAVSAVNWLHATSQFSVLIRQKMHLTGWDNGN